jgi:UDP-glucose 4-epimerase
MIDDKIILITGGTGSFGKTIVKKLLKEYMPGEIIVFSRDEKKQHDLRNMFDDPRIKFIIGDVRDREKVFRTMAGIDLVFHAAALKQVPTCEFFPMEAIKTNILGTNNVLDAAESVGVEKIVVLGTDKAVYPINAMGMTKALLEKLMLAKARTTTSNTVFLGVRYGNVMYSRGSVLPLFVEKILQRKPLTVTNPYMTRFMLPLPIAIDLVLFALQSGENGDILVRKSPASTIGDVAQSILDIFNSDVDIEVLGIREGEKIHETLVTREELMKSEDLDNYYRIKNLMKLDYDDYFTHGKENVIPEIGYTSENTERLNLDDTKKLILSLQEVQKVLN